MVGRIVPVTALAMLLLGATAPHVCAQGAYVSAALTGDVVRLDRVEGAGPNDSRGGEAIGFALRLGTELGSRWGVELEFSRPSKIENEMTPSVVPLSFEPLFTTAGATGTALPGTSLVFPSFSYRFRTSERNSTLSAGIWARQQISTTFSLKYLGGVGFRRTESDVSLTFEPSPLPALPIVLPPSVTRSTTYGTGPFVGVEGGLTLTEHVHLVPGVRLHGLSSGWLLRPSVGLEWTF